MYKVKKHNLKHSDFGTSIFHIYTGIQNLIALYLTLLLTSLKQENLRWPSGFSGNSAEVKTQDQGFSLLLSCDSTQ